LRRGLSGTALLSAWNWVAVAWIGWLMALLLSAAPRATKGTVEISWYVAAVLALTPPIAVLGARRPTSRVWTCFVLVPLVLVFTWPILTALHSGEASRTFSLEEPLLAGYGLVLVMGAGNYLALRYSLAALLWTVGLLAVVLPLCPTTARWMLGAENGRFWGTICVAAAGWIADRLAARSGRPGSGDRPALDRVWRDFRDLFGIVWSRRVQERFNDQARQTGLSLRLGWEGLEPAAGNPTSGTFDSQSLADTEKSLRWLLQKFVDPEWIDERLEAATPQPLQND
jgi:hypothetical protein